ncbi:uncharacterized protein METZ01_LOCUS320006, partial [marine metagenome]
MILGYLMAFAMVLLTTQANAQCTNTSAYGSAVAPTSGTAVISTCNFLTEYATVSGVVAGATYTCEISGANANPGYVTVVDTSGTTVGHGNSPFTWTATNSGDHYMHWHVDSSCATATG